MAVIPASARANIEHKVRPLVLYTNVPPSLNNVRPFQMAYLVYELTNDDPDYYGRDVRFGECTYDPTTASWTMHYEVWTNPHNKAEPKLLRSETLTRTGAFLKSQRGY